MNEAVEGELKTRLREKERHQRELEKLELNKVEYREKLDARRSRRNKIGVTRWEHRLRTCENEISAVRQEIYNFSEYIERIRRRNQEDVNKIKYDYQALVDSERKKITDIKVTQESVIKTKENENRQLHLSTSQIVGLMKQLREQKTLHATELESLTIPWQPEQTSLLGVPFYLVGYKKGDKTLYSVYPPLRAMNPEGIVKKIKKTLLSFRLESRIKLLLQLRSRALSKMFSLVVEEKMKTDRNFKEKLRELGASNNLLSSSNFKEALKEGLEELKAEGWIKPEEGTTMMKTYA
jgi:hypothetical protein